MWDYTSVLLVAPKSCKKKICIWFECLSYIYTDSTFYVKAIHTSSYYVIYIHQNIGHSSSYHNKIWVWLRIRVRGFRLACFSFFKWGNQTYFLKSANNFNISSFESLLLSCLKRAENLAFLSRVPEASLNNVLKVKILLLAEFMKVLKFISGGFF